MTIQESILKYTENAGLSISDLIESVGPPSKIMPEFQFTTDGPVTGERLYEILKAKAMKKYLAHRVIHKILIGLFREYTP